MFPSCFRFIGLYSIRRTESDIIGEINLLKGSGGFPYTIERKYDAEKFKTEMKIEKIRFETSGFTINNLITFKELSDDWYQNEVKNRKSQQTQRNYFADLKNYINPIVGHIKLRDINIRHARAIENNML